jgi:hypothetical protein
VHPQTVVLPRKLGSSAGLVISSYIEEEVPLLLQKLLMVFISESHRIWIHIRCEGRRKDIG